MPDAHVIVFLLIVIAACAFGIAGALGSIAGSLSRLADKHGAPAKKETDDSER